MSPFFRHKVDDTVYIYPEEVMANKLVDTVWKFGQCSPGKHCVLSFIWKALCQSWAIGQWHFPHDRSNIDTEGTIGRWHFYLKEKIINRNKHSKGISLIATLSLFLLPICLTAHFYSWVMWGKSQMEKVSKLASHFFFIVIEDHLI